VYVYKGHLRSVLAEGGGLCSPGLWPPERWLEPEGGLLEVRRAILAEIDLIADLPGGLGQFLARFVSGSLVDCPVPEDGTCRIRQAMLDATLAIPDHPGAQEQPIDIALLQRLLVLAGDPDAEVMDLYRVGVPIGVGVDLPRTAAVFPPKVRWSLKEQTEWGGESTEFAGFRREEAVELPLG
jgi:hypothetical protein